MSTDTNEPDVIDSNVPSVAEHVQRYLTTGGRSGHMEGGVTNLLLTTVGRRTDQRRRTALFYGTDEDRYVLIASHFTGGPRHPNWYLNLAETPQVEVQIRDEVFPAHARTAQGEERERLWRLMADTFPPYDRYQANAPRTIPVVVLERIPEARKRGM
jgi:F420H(2)-dependent quinone reductase